MQLLDAYLFGNLVSPYQNLATPSIHFYKSFQTTEIEQFCTLSEVSTTPYKSEQREYHNLVMLGLDSSHNW